MGFKSASGGRKGYKGRKYDQVAPPRVNSILGASFASLGIAAKIKEHNLKKAWAECVGENISRRTAPEKLIGSLLYCSVASSPWMTELVYQKKTIIDKLNEKLGSLTVTDIVFKIGLIQPPPSRPEPKKPARALTCEDKTFIEKTVSGIKDESLKEAIKKAMEKAKA